MKNPGNEFLASTRFARNEDNSVRRSNLLYAPEDLSESLTLTNDLFVTANIFYLFLKVVTFGLEPFLQLFHLCVRLLQRFLIELGFCDVDTRADITQEASIRGKSGSSVVKNPPKFAIKTAQAVLHLKFRASVKRLRVYLEACAQIAWVNTGGPSLTQLLFHRPSGKIQPSLVEEVAQFISARHPDHHRSGIGNKPETFFTFAKRCLRLLTFCDVANDYREKSLSGRVDLGNRSLDRELLAVRSHSPQSTKRTHRAICDTSHAEVANMVPMLYAEALRDEAVNGASDCVCRGAAEHFLGGEVKHDDALLIVDGDDSVHGRRDDPCQLLVARV